MGDSRRSRPGMWVRLAATQSASYADRHPRRSSRRNKIKQQHSDPKPQTFAPSTGGIWIANFDQATQKKFYTNSSTGLRVWERPATATVIDGASLHGAVTNAALSVSLDNPAPPTNISRSNPALPVRTSSADSGVRSTLDNGALVAPTLNDSLRNLRDNNMMLDTSRLMNARIRDVDDLLHAVGLSHHSAVLKKEGIDLAAVFYLTDDSLTEMGFNLGDRIKMLKLVEVLRAMPEMSEFSRPLRDPPAYKPITSKTKSSSKSRSRSKSKSKSKKSKVAVDSSDSEFEEAILEALSNRRSKKKHKKKRSGSVRSRSQSVSKTKALGAAPPPLTPTPPPMPPPATPPLKDIVASVLAVQNSKSENDSVLLKELREAEKKLQEQKNKEMENKMKQMEKEMASHQQAFEAKQLAWDDASKKLREDARLAIEEAKVSAEFARLENQKHIASLTEQMEKDRAETEQRVLEQQLQSLQQVPAIQASFEKRLDEEVARHSAEKQKFQEEKALLEQEYEKAKQELQFEKEREEREFLENERKKMAINNHIQVRKEQLRVEQERVEREREALMQVKAEREREYMLKEKNDELRLERAMKMSAFSRSDLDDMSVSSSDMEDDFELLELMGGVSLSGIAREAATVALKKRILQAELELELAESTDEEFGFEELLSQGDLEDRSLIFPEELLQAKLSLKSLDSSRSRIGSLAESSVELGHREKSASFTSSVTEEMPVKQSTEAVSPLDSPEPEREMGTINTPDSSLRRASKSSMHSQKSEASILSKKSKASSRTKISEQSEASAVSEVSEQQGISEEETEDGLLSPSSSMGGSVDSWGVSDFAREVAQGWTSREVMMQSDEESVDPDRCEIVQLDTEDDDALEQSVSVASAITESASSMLIEVAVVMNQIISQIEKELQTQVKVPYHDKVHRGFEQHKTVFTRLPVLETLKSLTKEQMDDGVSWTSSDYLEIEEKINGKSTVINHNAVAREAAAAGLYFREQTPPRHHTEPSYKQPLPKESPREQDIAKEPAKEEVPIRSRKSSAQLWDDTNLAQDAGFSLTDAQHTLNVNNKMKMDRLSVDSGISDKESSISFSASKQQYKFHQKPAPPVVVETVSVEENAKYVYEDETSEEASSVGVMPNVAAHGTQTSAVSASRDCRDSFTQTVRTASTQTGKRRIRKRDDSSDMGASATSSLYTVERVLSVRGRGTSTCATQTQPAAASVESELPSADDAEMQLLDAISEVSSVLSESSGYVSEVEEVLAADSPLRVFGALPNSGYTPPAKDDLVSEKEEDLLSVAKESDVYLDAASDVSSVLSSVLSESSHIESDASSVISESSLSSALTEESEIPQQYQTKEASSINTAQSTSDHETTTAHDAETEKVSLLQNIETQMANKSEQIESVAKHDAVSVSTYSSLSLSDSSSGSSLDSMKTGEIKVITKVVTTTTRQ